MLRAVLVLLGVLVLGYLGTGLIVVLRMTSPRRRPPGATPADVGLAYEDVELGSTDGVRLSGWWVPAEGSRRAAILVHGWGGDKSDEHVLATAPVYHREGFNVLVIDLRAQGESGGRRRTLGYREVRDVLGALLWLEGRGFRPEDTVLHGWSMGGTTVVRAAPRTGVAAVVEEAGYADLPLLLEAAIPRIAHLPRVFVPGVLLAGRLWPDFDAWAVRPGREASALRAEGVPLFVIHSTADGLIPVEHAGMFAAAYPDARVWILHGYDHVEAFSHPEYEERLRSFLGTITTERRPEPST
ncbi:MAG: alpha/beta hydrolase [Actinomycetota bacterium]|nr:alpha/beta hydrolase [Actinomycetota bacterium]